jgi:hypothetical protein
MQDDDVVAELWSANARSEGLVVGGHTDIREWRFHTSRDTVTSGMLSSPIDITTAHAVALGESLGSLLSRSAGDVEYGNACSHMITALGSSDQRTVRVTFAGVVGDSARYCSHGLLFKSGPVAEQLYNDAELFDKAVTHREVSVVTPKLLVTHDMSCSSYCIGIDNTSLMPPFMPLGRNEDGVWESTLTFVDPIALCAHLPWAVRHDSGRPPRYEELMTSARHSRIADFLLFAVTRIAPTTLTTTISDRMRHLGHLLCDAAALSSDDFRALLMEAKLSLLSQALMRADAQAGGQYPEHWRHAIEAYRRTFLENVQRPDYFLPIEFAGESVDRGFERMRQYIERFGELLIWWPTMWEEARTFQFGR